MQLTNATRRWFWARLIIEVDMTKHRIHHCSKQVYVLWNFISGNRYLESEDKDSVERQSEDPSGEWLNLVNVTHCIGNAWKASGMAKKVEWWWCSGLL